jgi:hypothetical protein
MEQLTATISTAVLKVDSQIGHEILTLAVIQKSSEKS